MAKIVAQIREDVSEEALQTGLGDPNRALIERELGYSQADDKLFFRAEDNALKAFLSEALLAANSGTTGANRVGASLPSGATTVQGALTELALALASLGPLGRGALSVPGPSSDGAPYVVVTGKENPITAVRAESILLSGQPSTAVEDVRFYIAAAEAAAAGVNDVEVDGAIWLYLRVSLGDDLYLRVYDTPENAAANGTTGLLAESDPISDTGGLVYRFNKISAGSGTNETWGWMFKPTGFPTSDEAFEDGLLFGLRLTSRDFSFGEGDLLARTRIELQSDIRVRGGGEDSEIEIHAALGPVDLFPGGAPRVYVPDLGGVSVPVKLLLTIDVEDRYNTGDDVEILLRSTLTCLSSSDSSAYSPSLVPSASNSQRVAVAVGTLGSVSRYLSVRGEATAGISHFNFLQSQVNIHRQPIVT